MIKPDGDALPIDLTPHATRFPSCGGCQKPCSTTHEYGERTVRDLPILGRAVRLCVLLRRVGGRDCGKRMEAVSWLDRYARMTRRLADAVTHYVISYDPSTKEAQVTFDYLTHQNGGNFGNRRFSFG